MILTFLKDRIIKVTRINLNINFRVAHFIPLLFFIFSCEKIPLSSENETGSIQFLIKIDNNNNTSVSPNQPSVRSKLNTVSTVQISLSGPQTTEVTLDFSGNSVSHTIEDLVEGTYSVKVSLKNSKGTLLYQQSKTVEVSVGATANPTFNNFTALNLSLYVSSPSGSLSFTDGQTISIDWDASHPAEPVKIQLMRSNSAVSTISASTKNSPISWSIPSTLTTSDKYSVKVSYISDTNVSSNSNDFGIKFPIWTDVFNDLTGWEASWYADFSVVSGRVRATGNNDTGNYQHNLRASPDEIMWWNNDWTFIPQFEYSVDIDFTSTANSDDWGLHGLGVVHWGATQGNQMGRVKTYYFLVGNEGTAWGVSSYDHVEQAWGDWIKWESNSSVLSNKNGIMGIKYNGSKLIFEFNRSSLYELNLTHKFNFGEMEIYHQDEGILYYDNVKIYDVAW
jgi:hypothetical protein